ncbi:MAG: hypothetical protein JO322_05180 [Candidatus Eremiobacteraeota bacterium]|nr:hypothetical protein [Candidatus Eremiobacteraeota bacterium]
MGRHLALAALVALAACNAQANAGAVQSTTDSVTKAVYNDDVDGVDSNFDSTLQSQVSRGDVGTLSDKMHVLGNYKGLTFLSTDAAKSEFTYRADFERGSMNVVVRIDNDGKLAAYRVFPQTQ